MVRFKELITAKLPLVHFVMFSMLSIVLVSLSYVLLIPLIHWTIYGEGEISVRVSEQPVKVFIYEWGALIIALCLCGVYFFRAQQRQKLDRAKSYIFIAVVLLVIYPFRQEIGNFILNSFYKTRGRLRLNRWW